MFLMLLSCSRSTCSIGNMTDLCGTCRVPFAASGPLPASAPGRPARLGSSKEAASPSLLLPMLSTAKLVKDEKPEICITHNWLEDPVEYLCKCAEQQAHYNCRL